jgi:hypothetical protein
LRGHTPYSFKVSEKDLKIKQNHLATRKISYKKYKSGRYVTDGVEISSSDPNVAKVSKHYMSTETIEILGINKGEAIITILEPDTGNYSSFKVIVK